MARKLFGTDGVRGRANEPPMTAEIALRLGLAAGTLFTIAAVPAAILVIGKDTRLSGYMLETALIAGFTCVGMDVFLVGPVPTPGRRHAGPLDARRPRGDDLGLAQSLRGQRHQVLRPRRLQALRRASRRRSRRDSTRARTLAGPQRIGHVCASTMRAAATSSSPRPPSPRAAARRPQGRRRLRQWRGLPDRARLLCELGAEVIPRRRPARRLQHQRGLRLDPSGRRRRRGRRRTAPTSASPSTATPTA